MAAALGVPVENPPVKVHFQSDVLRQRVTKTGTTPRTIIITLIMNLCHLLILSVSAPMNGASGSSCFNTFSKNTLAVCNRNESSDF